MTPINQAAIVERKPRDWITCTLVVCGECVVFVSIGYFARPVIEPLIWRML